MFTKSLFNSETVFLVTVTYKSPSPAKNNISFSTFKIDEIYRIPGVLPLAPIPEKIALELIFTGKNVVLSINAAQ